MTLIVNNKSVRLATDLVPMLMEHIIRYLESIPDPSCYLIRGLRSSVRDTQHSIAYISRRLTI